MSQKPSLLYSIFHQKCPRCRQGDLFVSSAYDLPRFLKMYEKCDHCGLRYELEPSFFYGAMYVSYAFQIALFVAVFVAIQVLYPQADTWVYIVGVIGGVLLLFPVIIRYSRTIWIHIFVKYRG